MFFWLIFVAIAFVLAYGFLQIQSQLLGNTIASVIAGPNEEDVLEDEARVEQLLSENTSAEQYLSEIVLLKDNLKTVTAAAITDDGDVLIADQFGTLYFNDNVLHSFVEQLAPFGNLVERGLLGLALSPFAKNQLFLSVTLESTQPDEYDHDLVVLRFDFDSAGLRNRLEILRVPQQNKIHNGGCLRFSPTNQYLHIAIGDGGPQGDPNGHAQNDALLQGKLLRINVSQADATTPYTIPSENPTSVGRREILALGLRNPWQFQFADDGSIWIGDVGWSAREMIYHYTVSDLALVASTGQPINSRWPFMEGHKFRQSDLTELDQKPHIKRGPVFQYATGSFDGARSVIGGVALSDSKYMFSDFLTAHLYVIAFDANEWSLEAIVKAENWIPAEGSGWMLSSISFDRQSRLLLLGVNTSGSATESSSTGRLYAARL